MSFINTIIAPRLTFILIVGITDSVTEEFPLNHCNYNEISYVHDIT